MAEIHAARRAAAARQVAEAGADAALITSGPNVRYLTGLASSNAAVLLPAEGTAVLATDSRYALAAQRDCPDTELVIERFIETRLAAEMTARGQRTVAFEAHEMTVERHAELTAKAGGVNLIPFGRKIEELRVVKDPSELELLATACRISDQAIADVFARIRPGLTERQLAAALDRRMVELGAERPAFDTIVASGPNGALPHHSPTDRPMRRGDLITMDFGARYGGYHADMTRTVALGEPPAGSGRSTSWSRPRSEPGSRRPGPARRWPTWTPPRGTSSATPGTASISATAWGTAWAWRCTRPRRSGTPGRVNLPPGSRLPSSLASTCPAGAESGSRTSWSWEPTGRACSPRRREIFSSFDLETPNVATTNDLKNGITLNLDHGLWTVVEFQHVKPGKGPAFVRTKLKNVTTGKVVDRTFNAGIKVDVATIDRREMQYLYREGADFVFMDMDDYDQPHVPAAVVGDAANYLLEEQTVTVAFNDGLPLYVDLPAAVELTISQTDPGLQGDRSTGGSKPATLETGATIQVPLFISTGEKIKVDTRTGQYLGRA